jgi:hypothetical protein
VDLITGTSHERREIFATALVAWLISDYPVSPHASQIADRAIDWLLENRDERGLWSFHGASGAYPPDLDDTAVSLLAIGNRHPQLRPQATELMTLFDYDPEKQLFGTWVRGCADRQTFDATANSHALLALTRSGGLVPPSLPPKVLRDPQQSDRRLISPYYCTKLPFLIAQLQLSAVSETSTDVHGIIGCTRQALHELGDGPIYRRRSRPVFYHSAAVMLAYRYWFGTFLLRYSLPLLKGDLDERR